MEDIPKYIVVLDFCEGRVLKIKLSKEEKEYAAQCDELEDVMDMLSEKHRFAFSNCQRMELEEMKEENIGF